MPREPRAIGTILAELMARNGFARVQAAEAYGAAWRQAAGELAAGHTRVGGLRRGVLEVVVANSVLVQELSFRKAALLKALTDALPGEPIRDLRFRLGPL